MDYHNINNALKQVEQQKQKAIGLGLMEVIEDLYDDLRYMHVSLQRDSSIWKSHILKASCLQGPKSKKIFLKLNNDSEYAIVFNDNSCVSDFRHYDEWDVTGGHEVLIFAGEQKLLGLAFEAVSDNEFPITFYRVTDITAFREGNWIKDFQGLHKTKRANTKATLDKTQADQVKRLQDDFGI